MKKQYIKEIIKILRNNDFDFTERVYYFIVGMVSVDKESAV